MAMVSRERMTQMYLDIWRRNRKRLLGDLYEQVNQVADHLLSDGIISTDDHRWINKILRDCHRRDPKKDAARELTFILEYCGALVLPNIIKSLRDMRYVGLSDHFLEEMQADHRQDQVQNGAMRPEHADIWNRFKPDLIDNFHQHLNDIIDTLVSHNIISRDDEARIGNAARQLELDDPKAGARELVEILSMRGENVLQRLVTILEELKFGDLAQRLYNEVDKTNLMNPRDLRIWGENSEYLKSKFAIDLPRFLRLFLEAGIISENDRLEIEGLERNSSSGAEHMLEVLTKRGENVLDRIKAALKAGEYEDIVTHLEQCIVENLPNVPIEESSQVAA